MYSPYNKDIVAQLAVSCKKYDLKLGIYLSPWDRHDHRYGQGKPYDDYFCDQLTELLTNYGEVFCVWFDGACGEGPNGKKQIYDWERYYSVIRRLQPDAVISVCGPDVRWCGNEAGHCRKSEWSVVPKSMADNEKVQSDSQKEDDEQFRTRIPSDEQDLGSREVLINAGPLAWYPAEVNTSIRPGWFYHADEDDKIRSLEELSSIYIQSVGGNACFLLNIPPHPDGYIAAPDVGRLTDFGKWLRSSFSLNLLKNAAFTASNYEKGHGPEALKFEDEYWKSPADENIWIEADAGCEISPAYFMAQEEIRESQRIESFHLEYYDGTKWQTACEGTVIGYKRICPLISGAVGSVQYKELPPLIKARRWRLSIPRSRDGAALKTFALY